MTQVENSNTVFLNRVREQSPNSPSTVSTVFSPYAARVNYPTSAWFNELSDRFTELTGLQQGWDGYGGLPVSFPCAIFAATIIERLYSDGLSAPQLVPGCDGSLQLEWHENGYDIEIDVLAPYEVIANRFDHVSGVSEEIELDSDFLVLLTWIRDLKNRSPDVAQVGT
ncbi:MAG: hypothetical protein AAGI88_02480 [Pseudomonadota bacterium]